MLEVEGRLRFDRWQSGRVSQQQGFDRFGEHRVERCEYGVLQLYPTGVVGRFGREVARRMQSEDGKGLCALRLKLW